MKLKPLVLLTFIAASVFAYSQDEPTGASPESAVAPVASPTTARILGTIPDGTPPPPAPPKPEFHISKREILDTATHEQGGRTITIRQIKPIALPPPPPPVAQPMAAADSAFSQRLAEYRDEHPKSCLLFLGATVFRSKDSAPRTLVRYWPEGTREAITFWSSADFALIAGGINSFVDSAADTHYLIMGWSNVEIELMTELKSARGLDQGEPALPDFSDDIASFQIAGKQPAAEDIAPIQALHDLYNSELERLRTAFEGREKARIEHEAYLKANPPQPKNITLNYWRTEKSATKGNGGTAR
jgi:hypothetical protein